MALGIREGLGDLCRGHGWSYGVCWQFDQQDPRLLVISDSCYEEQMGTTIDNLIKQVHLVGEGTIGVVAVSGKLQWIYSDTYQMELNPTSFNDNVEMLKGNIEWQHQFLAGMKTIVIISLPSFGVVQFGSTQKIHESVEFVNEVQQFFKQLGATKGHYVPGQPYKYVDVCDPREVFASVIPSVNTYTSSKSFNSLHDVITKELQGNAEPSTSCVPSSNLFNNTMHSNYTFPCNSFFTNSNASNWAKEISRLQLPEQRLLPGVATNSSSSPAMSSSKSSSFASELPDDFLSFPQDSAPEHPTLFQFQDNQIHPCEEPKLMKDNTVNVQSKTISCSTLTDLPSIAVEISSNVPTELLLDNDLFQDMELDLSPSILRQECWDDMIMPVVPTSCSMTTSVSESISEMNMGVPSGSNFEQLLEAVVEESVNLSSSQTSPLTNVSTIGGYDLEHQASTVTRMECQLYATQDPSPELSLEKIIQQYSKEAFSNLNVSSWIEDSCTVNAESVVTNQPKKPVETAKVARKRARPGESTRPRPKDRQQIQDRVKELREIVPDSAKCSIDSLLDRTIKHMLFLQSLTKYADKLKQTDETKMIGEASGVVLKDNSTGGRGNSGGATWAYEVASQTMVCPILVEDLNPPGQMLVEMLCEERGFFLEIADIIRAIGLTILKGVMEIRESKIWGRFLVETNRDITRMDIFLSLVQLLQQTSNIRASEQQTKVPDKGVPPAFTNYQQPQLPIPISIAGRLR